MRRKDRELTELADILQVIEQCRICRLAMSDAEGLYLVPMHFGYAYADGRLELYFHSAREGRKIDALRANPQVCFEMDCDMQVYAGNAEIPCTYSSRFLSVIGNGRAEFLEQPAQKAAALNAILRHQAGREFTFTEAMLQGVVVFRVVAESFSGKQHE